MAAATTRIDAKKLQEFAAAAFVKAGFPADDARVAARVLVATDLRGTDSHGITNLGGYVRGGLRGDINLHPKPRMHSVARSTATLDGDRGLGFVIGHRAMQDAIRRAKKTGAGFVAVRNSTHFGAASYYAMMALEHDMVGFALSNGPARQVAPGTARAALGTNPLAVAAPAGARAPYVLDMSTCVAADGRIVVARRDGTPIPAGWIIDEQGNPVTDPVEALKMTGRGGPLPLGGTPEHGVYKGFGLGVLVDILSSLLSGSCADILWPNVGRTARNAADHFFGALRIDSFLPAAGFKQAMDGMIEAFEALPTLPGAARVAIAGSREAGTARDREASGVPLRDSVVQELKDLAAELGIAFDLC